MLSCKNKAVFKFGNVATVFAKQIYFLYKFDNLGLNALRNVIICPEKIGTGVDTGSDII